MYWELKWALCIKEYQVLIPRIMNSFTTPYLLRSFCDMGIGPWTLHLSDKLCHQVKAPARRISNSKRRYRHEIII